MRCSSFDREPMTVDSARPKRESTASRPARPADPSAACSPAVCLSRAVWGSGEGGGAHGQGALGAAELLAIILDRDGARGDAGELELKAAELHFRLPELRAAVRAVRLQRRELGGPGPVGLRRLGLNEPRIERRQHDWLATQLRRHADLGRVALAAELGLWLRLELGLRLGLRLGLLRLPAQRRDCLRAVTPEDIDDLLQLGWCEAQAAELHPQQVA